jgi:hypothetical protein
VYESDSDDSLVNQFEIDEAMEELADLFDK